MGFEKNNLSCFGIPGKTAIITGGGGLMADSHAKAVISGGGIPCLVDISDEKVHNEKQRLLEFCKDAIIETFVADITNRDQMELVREEIVKKYGRIDILINNASNNPKVEGNTQNMGAICFENLPMEVWETDIAVGLTGAFVCAQVFGKHMESQRSGVILNISSDLGIIAPDQRIYRKEGFLEKQQVVKPVTYSVIKHGIIGLTKYLATYWADKGIRCNALCPGGIENGQDPEFIGKLTNLIPMARMARKDEYQATVLYMISDASAYMTGANVVVDGGRTCW